MPHRPLHPFPFAGILASLVLTARMALAQCGPPVPTNPSGQEDGPPSRARLWISLPASAALGMAAGAGGFLLGGNLLGCSDDGPECEHAPDNAEYWIGGGTGLVVGSAVGAYLGGLRSDSRGRITATLAGAFIGATPLLFDKIFGGYHGEHPSALTYVGIVTTPVGAAFANYLFRVPRGSGGGGSSSAQGSGLELRQLGVSSAHGRLVATAGFRF